jgi:hypothetical protein
LGVELTLCFLILVVAFWLPWVGIPLVLIVVVVFGIHGRIAPWVSARSRSDRVAWLAFIIGVWTMIGIAVISLFSDGDGAYRTWDQIRRQVRILLAAGIIGAGVPLLVAIWQRLRRRDSGKSSATLE